MNLRLAVFDLDGVIVSTDMFHFEAWKRLFAKRWGIVHTPAAEELTKGVARFECMKLLAHYYDIHTDDEELRLAAEEKNKIYQQLLMEQLSPSNILPGILQTLALLKERGVYTALASSSRNAPFIIKRLGLEFDYCVDPATISHGKPAPDIYLAAMNHFGVSAQECVGVEDAVNGVASILSAGMPAIGIGPATISARADVVLETTAQLPQVFEELLDGPQQLDWTGGFCASLALPARLKVATEQRRLSQLSGYFGDQREIEKILASGSDPLVYEYHQLNAPQDSGDIAFGVTTLYPGVVGTEFYMTKGHFHGVLETGEVYYTLSGSGLLLTENQNGHTRWLPLAPGRAAYAAKGFAHRMVNTGNEPLVCFFAYRADAGHDYKTIEQSGFQKVVLCTDGGGVSIQDNPKKNTGGRI